MTYQSSSVPISGESVITPVYIQSMRGPDDRDRMQSVTELLEDGCHCSSHGGSHICHITG